MKIRPIKESDRDLLELWIAEDPDHSGKGMRPDFFFLPMTLGIVFEDDYGPVFFVRLDPETSGAVRIHMQFNGTQLIRTARMLNTGFPIVCDRARLAGASRLVFDSVYPPLIDYCCKRLGFHRIDGSEDLEYALG